MLGPFPMISRVIVKSWEKLQLESRLKTQHLYLLQFDILLQLAMELGSFCTYAMCFSPYLLFVRVNIKFPMFQSSSFCSFNSYKNINIMNDFLISILIQWQFQHKFLFWYDLFIGGLIRYMSFMLMYLHKGQMCKRILVAGEWHFSASLLHGEIVLFIKDFYCGCTLIHLSGMAMASL